MRRLASQSEVGYQVISHAALSTYAVVFFSAQTRGNEQVTINSP